MQEVPRNFLNMNSLKEKYIKEAIPVLREKFAYKNNMAVPRLGKAVINIGINQNKRDAKYLETIEGTLKRISGQKSADRKAKKSISGFKIREGMVIGKMVNLRGKRMYDFAEKLIKVTLPRIRDFRGLSSKAVDESGNLHIGFKEHIAFPEISSDEVEQIHGLGVTIVTNAKTRDEGLELFKLLGFPFKKD